MKKFLLLALLPASLGAQNTCDVKATSWRDCKTGIYQLMASPATYSDYEWLPAANVSNPSIPNPTTTIAGTYTVNVYNTSGPNLLANPDFSLGNTGFSGGHTYSSFYSPCNYYVNNTFFTLGGSFPDHSPSADNMFMSIDGCNPVTTIWQQTIPVNSNTVYLFDFWASRADQVQPNFQIEFIGDITGSSILNTVAGIPYTGTWTWDKYRSGCWNSGPNRTVTIKINNLQTNGYGNDFGLDDMSFKTACCNSATVSTINMGQELVVNGDFSGGNIGFTSGHTYTSVYSQCNYYVNNTFFTLPSPATFPDHTASTTDNMFMSVDGCNPATIVWQQTMPVAPNQVYKFEFWASKADVAQPKFQIVYIGNNTGTTTFPTQNGTPYTGTWQWEQFGIGCWNSQTNTSVTIRVINVETASMGNDFGMDDFSFRQCCSPKACCNSIPPTRLAGTPDDAVSVQLFPNPTSDMVTIQLSEDITATEVKVFDATGRQVIAQDVNGNSIRLETGHLPDGIYFVRVMHTGGMLKAMPLTIQH